MIYVVYFGTKYYWNGLTSAYFSKSGKGIRLRRNFCRSRISAGFGKNAGFRPESVTALSYSVQHQCHFFETVYIPLRTYSLTHSIFSNSTPSLPQHTQSIVTEPGVLDKACHWAVDGPPAWQLPLLLSLHRVQWQVMTVGKHPTCIPCKQITCTGCENSTPRPDISMYTL